jgi:hypothetical protein
MFDKVTGSNTIRLRFSENYRWSDIKDYWNKDILAYRNRVIPYFLYH